MNEFQQAAQQAFQDAQKLIQSGGYQFDPDLPGETPELITRDFAIKNLADKYGATFVSQNLAKFAPYIPGLDPSRAGDQLSNLIRMNQAAVAGQDNPLEKFLGKALPLAIAAGGVYTGLGAGGFLGGGAGGAEGLAAADAAGGLMPEYGTTAAYNAGIGTGTSGAGATGNLASTLSAAGSGGPSMPGAIPEVDPTFGGALTQTGAGQYENLLGQFGTTGGAAVGGVAGGAAGSAVGGTAAAAGAGGVGATKVGDLVSGKVSPSDLASNMTIGDLSKALGTIGLTAGSIYGDTKTADALKSINDQYMAIGAPSRARYESSFAPGFDINSLPGLQGAMDTSTQTLLRQLSAQGGNPWGNPGGLAEALKYVTGNVALPALQNYRNQNAASGGFGAFSTAAPAAATGAVNAGSNVYSDLGRGAATIFNPPTSLQDALKSLRGLS